MDAVLELIEMKCIFNIFKQNDNLLLKRIAKVASDYGTSGDMNKGGIWQVGFNLEKKRTDSSAL